MPVFYMILGRCMHVLFIKQRSDHSKNVSYGLRTHNSGVCSVCDIFTSEDYGFIPYAQLIPVTQP